jgi:hypothetical protein
MKGRDHAAAGNGESVNSAAVWVAGRAVRPWHLAFNVEV